MYPIGQCTSSISATSWVILFIAMLFWQFRTIKVIYHALQYYDIKKFYNSALKIEDVSVCVCVYYQRKNNKLALFCTFSVRDRQFDLA